MGAASTRCATRAQSTPLYHAWFRMSFAPFARQPYRLDRSACHRTTPHSSSGQHSPA